MKRNALALVVGLIFGLGLCLSGMSEPGPKCLAFSISPAPGILRWPSSWAARSRSLCRPLRSRAGGASIGSAAISICRTLRAIDAPLLLGAAIFGVGWGLAGVCPGPGIVDVGFLSPSAMIFVAAMAAGMLTWRVTRGLGLLAPRALTQDA